MKKTLKTKSNKMSLKEFIWYGFNFVVSASFVNYYALAANASANGGGLGFYAILVWIIGGLFAFICVKAFARMSQVHDASQNGASYVYARSTFGRMTGLLVGFLQYAYLPFSITFTIMVCFKGSFAEPFVSQASAGVWGPFNDLWMDLIGIGIFVICAVAVSFGMKWFKRIGSASGIVKWLTFFIMIIAALYIACAGAPNNPVVDGKPVDVGNAGHNLAVWAANSHFKFGWFIKAFNSSFFAFVGCELVITAGKNIENPNKNISKGLAITMLIASLFYVFFCFLLFMSSTPNWLPESYNISIFDVFVPWLQKFGMIVAIIGVIFSRLITFVSKTLYGGTVLQPLSKEGFISERFGQLGKDDMPISAIKLNIILILCSCSLFLIIPDIIKGSLIASNHFDQNQVFFDMSGLSSFASLITLIVYFMVVLCTLWLTKQKKIKCKFWEIIGYFIAEALVIVVLVYHFYDLINGVVTSTTNWINKVGKDPLSDFIKAITKISIELFSLVLVFSLFFINYFTYYKRKLLSRTKAQQKKLDAPFRLLTLSEQKRLD